MNEPILGHHLRATVLMALLVVFLLLTLVVLVEPDPTTIDRDGNPAVHAMGGSAGTSITHDPYISRHAEVVARYQEGGPR